MKSHTRSELQTHPFGGIELPKNIPGVSGERSPQTETDPKEKFDWMNVANQILPYVRPTNAEELDPRQLAGEMSMSLDAGVNTLMNKINAAGGGKVDRTQIINALEAYQDGNVGAYESLIPFQRINCSIRKF